MSTLEDILGQLPIDQIAGRLGVDPTTAQSAVSAVLPALLGGLHANAQDPAGADALARAVGQHDPDLLNGGVDLDQVDTVDGDKIVDHVFGDNRQQVVSQLSSTSNLGGLGGVGGGLVAKLLPMLAPIVMAYLAKQFLGGGSAAKASSQHAGAQASEQDSAQGSGGLSDILGSILGGGGQGGGAGLDLGSILGGLGGLLGRGTR